MAAFCALSDLVVIEDIDLTGRALRRHLEANQLTSLAASDATDRARMHGTNLLCVCRREKEELLPGRRIW